MGGQFQGHLQGKECENNVVIKMKEVGASAEATVAFEKEVTMVDMFPVNCPVCREKDKLEGNGTASFN